MAEEVIVRAYKKEDIADMVRIWNQVVDEGVAFHSLIFLMTSAERNSSLNRPIVQ